jgi:hypothetical protein
MITDFNNTADLAIIMSTDDDNDDDGGAGVGCRVRV